MTGTLIAQADARALPLRDESVHLVVTSPPYNAGIPYDGSHDWLPWADYWQGLIEPALRECFRVLVHGGRLCLNLANVIRPAVGGAVLGQTRRARAIAPRDRPSREDAWPIMVAAQLWPLIEQIGFIPREQLTWIKGPDVGEVPCQSTAWGTYCSARNPVLRAVVEPIFIASKGSYAREPGASDLTADEFKRWSRNAWTIPTSGRESAIDHPSVFPPELPRRLIKLYSYVGDVVLDPFVGSGTTVKVAKQNGRKGIGLDISAKYVRQSAGRSAQEVMSFG